MQTVPRETPRRGGDDQLYQGDTKAPAAALWRVEMAVGDLLWWPAWTGYATDSTQAQAFAAQWFKDRHGSHGPLNVRAVYQAGV